MSSKNTQSELIGDRSMFLHLTIVQMMASLEKKAILPFTDTEGNKQG